MAATNPSQDRVAQILVGAKGEPGIARVVYQGKLTSKDVTLINERLVGVIEKLTGCACLSGIIDVMWERKYQEVIDVRY
jgi:hypothetical protein